MGARTGSEFLAGLRKPREIWVGDDRVADVVSHPAFAGAAQTLAELFDLQHQAAEICLMPDPETGEPINVSHLIPRSRADLERRHRCLQRTAEFTVGLMGRTPDYMNVTYAGFAGRADEWVADGSDRGAANLVDYQKLLARKDISLTHTIVHPTIDKATGDAPAPGNDVALHKVADTAHGIVVRGARILATLAPFADELAVYPAHPLPEGADAYALSFCIPMGTPGLKFLCRDSCSTPPNLFDRPLSSRFDEQDAFVIFDDVEIPRDRLFIDADRDVYNRVMTTGWYPNVMQQTMIRAQTKLEFAYGLGTRMAEAINDVSPATKQLLGEIWTYAEFTRAAIHSAEAEAFEYGNGVWFPNGAPLTALRAALPTWFPRVGRDPHAHRLPQSARHADGGAAPRREAAPADRSLPPRRETDRLRGARAHLPPRVGLSRQRAGGPKRALRALLSRVRRAQLPDRRRDRVEGSRAASRRLDPREAGRGSREAFSRGRSEDQLDSGGSKMSVLDGAREEWRRILHEGQPKWVKPEGEVLRLGDGRQLAEREAVYLPPCDPTKILCIHLNYESRRVEFRAPQLETPTYFQKPTTALNAHRGTLMRPAGHKYLNYEGEIAVIIGKPMRNVGRDEAWDSIAGFAARERRGLSGLSRDRRGLDAAGQGSGRLLPDRSRHRPRRRRAQSHGAHLPERQRRPGRGRHRDDLPDRLHPGRPVAVHHAVAGRHHPFRHAEELAADERRRSRRSRGERPRPPVEPRRRGSGSGASSRASTHRYGFGPSRRARIGLLQGEGTVTGAESLVRTALDAGIEVCFANPGTTEMPLVTALDSVPGMRAVLGLFEGVCTGAADGYARMRGKPAMTLLHLGPGFANGLANLHNARRAHSPVVNVVGDQATWHLAADAPLTSDIAGLAAPMSRWVKANTSVETLGADTAEAIRQSLEPPGGVATLTVPADCQWSEGGSVARVGSPSPRTTVAGATIERVAAALRRKRVRGDTARRPGTHPPRPRRPPRASRLPAAAAS